MVTSEVLIKDKNSHEDHLLITLLNKVPIWVFFIWEFHKSKYHFIIIHTGPPLTLSETAPPRCSSSGGGPSSLLVSVRSMVKLSENLGSDILHNVAHFCSQTQLIFLSKTYCQCVAVTL